MFTTRLLRAAWTLIFASCPVAPAMAQAAYPSRPISLIVPFPAGGSSDILARAFAEKLQADLGQSVVVDNRTGGATVIGTQAAASAKPDGHTILQVTPNAVIIGSLQPGLPYDFQRDLAPVVGVGAVPLLLAVSGKGSIHSIADLIAAAKAGGGGLTYASGGVGSLGHLAPARFMRELKVTGTHVPYRGVNPALQDVAAGRVHFMFVSSLEGTQMAKNGLIRVLGVTAEQRLPGLPEVPTMAELGFADFTPAVWYGFVVPSGTPAAVVDRLAVAFSNAASDAAVRERLGGLGMTVQLRNAAEFGRYMRDEAARWERVVNDNHIKLE